MALKFDDRPATIADKGNGKMKKLTLDRMNKKIWGVCGGIANWSGIDVTIVRIAFVLATLFGFGSALIVYVALGLILD